MPRCFGGKPIDALLKPLTIEWEQAQSRTHGARDCAPPGASALVHAENERLRRLKQFGHVAIEREDALLDLQLLLY